MTNEAVLSTKKEKHLITEKIQRQKKLKTQLTRFAVTLRVFSVIFQYCENCQV